MVTAAAAIVWDVNRKALSRARLSLPRLYEDETVIVVDKPAGLLSVPSAPGKEGEDTARDRVLRLRRQAAPAAALRRRRPSARPRHFGRAGVRADAGRARGSARALQSPRDRAPLPRDRAAGRVGAGCRRRRSRRDRPTGPYRVRRWPAAHRAPRRAVARGAHALAGARALRRRRVPRARARDRAAAPDPPPSRRGRDAGARRLGLRIPSTAAVGDVDASRRIVRCCTLPGSSSRIR